MQYGFFDDQNKEYVIENPQTPRSWSNYLGSTKYGAIITNNAGGYSFYKSAAQGRFTRLRLNAIAMDQPGRYFYLRDNHNSDYWSASWQPVGKPLGSYKSQCRHGTAYTRIRSEYARITTDTLYFVPLGRNFECWLLSVKNEDAKRRDLSVFTYVEYANNWNMLQDFINIQYSQYIVKMDVIDAIIDHGTNVNMPANPEKFEDDGQRRHTFLTVIGSELKGFDTDRELFLGPYRTYANPIAVEEGRCRNSLAAGDNACGVLHFDLSLDPDEEREVVVIMGIGSAGMEGKRTSDEFAGLQKVHDEFEKLKNHWHTRLEGMSVETPDKAFDSMMNMWNPYNCLITYAWSRAASLVYNGERDGLGFRDTVQDLLGVIHTIPSEAGERLAFMLSGQVSTGGAMPVVKPFAHHPGKEPPPRDEEYRSDDCLWLFNSVPAYVKESGDLSFFNKDIAFADRGTDTVCGHLKQAIMFSLQRSGTHGLPCGLFADWNDCLELGQQGETVFVAFQLRYALAVYIEICELLNMADDRNWAEKKLAELDQAIEEHAWDGDWYLRAFRHDGLKFGSAENEEASIFLNSQTWAVISGHATGRRAQKVMDAVHQRLLTDYGLMLCDPPVVKTDPKVIKAVLFNPGMKENASVFCHTQGWAVIAEAILGHGDRAYDYCRRFLPAAFNDQAEIRQTEPYVYCQSTHSKYSPRYGASRLSWLTGSAAWATYAANQYILGLQPDYHGLRIDPCLPSSWRKVKIVRRFRNKNFNITLKNPDGVQKGVAQLILDRRQLKDNIIPETMMQKENNVTVILG